MAKLFGLDVPDYLLPAWQRLVKSLPAVPDQNVALNYPTVTRQKAANLTARSLFNLWKPLWATFLSARRTAWQDYWGTLPFGSHSGANFYPGSGFSAFVYVNAPRYRSHLSLLLDPPAFDGGLVLNGQFNDGLDHWEVWDDTLEVVIDGALNFLPHDSIEGDPIPLIQDLPALEMANYRVQFDAIIPDPVTEGWGGGDPTMYLICNLGFFEVGFTDLDEYPNRIIVPTNHGVPTHYSFDIPSWYDDGFGDFDTHIFFTPRGIPFDIGFDEETGMYTGSAIQLDDVSVKPI